MRIPLFRNKRRRVAPLEGQEAVRSVYSKFRRIQKLNTAILERISEMERALGGEYIFDQAFLESSVRNLNADAYQVVYSLNALSDNRYVELFDRYQDIKGVLDDILSGGLGPYAGRMALPYSVLGYEMEPLAGMLNVCLAEARRNLDLSAPDGFAVTVTGCRSFFEYNGLFAALKERGRSGVESLFGGAEIPAPLARALERESTALMERCGTGVRLTVRVGFTGSDGSSQPDLRGLSGVDTKELSSACRSVLAEYVSFLGDEEWERLEDLSVALAVHETIPVQVTGTISALGPAGDPHSVLAVEASPVDAPERIERYALKRVYPFDLIRAEIVPKPLGVVRAGKQALALDRNGLRYGSALVGPAFLRTLAQCAVGIERILGLPHEVHWGRTNSPLPVVFDVRPLCCRMETDYPSDEPVEALRNAEVLLKGGETAQSGVAAGKIIHLTHDLKPSDFPSGAIAVAKQASPNWSPFLRRASAIVTEIGSTTGHLATIARELRVPAIVGVPHALRLLPEGIEVTVDAGEPAVYRGTVESLFYFHSSGTDLYPTDPEYMTLRRLLRWIMPLNLIDPESGDFTPQNCRTYHDLIHYAHERSVEDLIGIQERQGGANSFQTCRLELDAPLDLFVLDIDRGLSPGAGPSIGPEEVASEPFAAFLEGVAFRSMWARGPASIGLRDILSGIARTPSLTSLPQYAGKNLAVVARHYMNVGLRLGYHFSVIDAHLSDNVNRNTVYFRFVGGFADAERRRRRAELIRRILEEIGFKVSVNGDLVVGKMKIADREETANAVVRLGELTAFTRQMDVAMASDETVEEFARLFMKTVRGSENPEE